MEFRILGPLEVIRDDVPLAIRGRHHPKLLAALLTDGGVVSLSRLVEVLWDEEPPLTARRQVQNYVAALRRGFGDDDPVEAVGEGYRLKPNGVEVDAVRFESLRTSAREDVEAARLSDALAKLVEALGMWRGAALDGLSGRVVRALAARWDEKRLDTVQDWADVCLRLRRHAEVADTLREVVAQHPLRQRIAGNLMVALYRCGWASQAQRVFDELRARLADEIGIDPDPFVRALHEKILRKDPVLDYEHGEEPASGTRPGTPVPAQLPTGVATFTGRDEELAALDKMLDTGSGVAVVSAVSGGGGVGKTALAVHWGRKHRDRFPDGQLYINLRGFDHRKPVAPIEALSRFLRALGVPLSDIPGDSDRASAMYRNIMGGRRMLVILDNGRTVEQVSPLLPGDSRSLALVTSRNRLTNLVADDDARLIDLEVLNPHESLRLLSDLIGADRAHADLDSVRQLAELCGHLPLALRIMAAKVANDFGVAISDVVSRLDDKSRLEQLTVAADPSATVTATFDLSYNALDDPSRFLFVQLALIPGEDFPKGLAYAVSNLDESVVADQMYRLENANLIEVHESGRYRFHDLVRLYARSHADDILGDVGREKVCSRIAEWYESNRNRIGWKEESNVIATCEVLRDHPQLWQVAAVLFQFAVGGRSVRIALHFARRALTVAEAYNHAKGKARILGILTVLYGMTGDDESGFVISRQLVELLHERADVDEDGVIRTNLALFLYWQGYFHEAERLLREALCPEILREHQVRELRRVTLLGNVNRAMGKFADAHRFLDRAIKLAGTVPIDSAIASAESATAKLKTDMGLYMEAREYANRALRRARVNGWRRHEAIALLQIGVIEHCLGNVRTARASFHDSMRVAKTAEATGSIREVVLELAAFESEVGDPQRALDLARKADHGAEAQLSRVESADKAKVLCKVFISNGDMVKAIEHGLRARDAYAAMPYVIREARTLALLATAYHVLGNDFQADKCRSEAFAIFDRLDHPEAAALRVDTAGRP